MKTIHPKWIFTVKDGKIEIQDRKNFDRYILHTYEGKVGEIVAKPYRKPRSSGQVDEKGNQNGYYWAVIVRMISDELGLFDQETHKMLQQQFLVVGRTALNGIRYETVRSTSDLDTAEFEDYCAKIRTWASIPGNICELGLLIPLPNEVQYQE